MTVDRFLQEDVFELVVLVYLLKLTVEAGVSAGDR